MTDYIEAWQCTGCGRIEAPQPCIGVCRDRKVLMVGKDQYETAQVQLHELQAQLESAMHVLSRLAHSTPREGRWEQSYRAFQSQALDVLASRPIRETGPSPTEA